MKSISISEINASIVHILVPYCDCIAWSDFSDKGNACYSPYTFATKEEEYEAAFTHAAVMLAIPKNGSTHKTLAEKIADQLGNNWITYDWLIKAVGRLLSGTSYRELYLMAILSRKVKNGMKAKELKQINSLQEAN